MHSRRRRRWVDCSVAALVGGALMLGVERFLPGAGEPLDGHGHRFVAMARAPFAFDGEIPQRVLWPALAWLAAKVGIGPLAFSHLCSGLLLAVVAWFARQRTRSWFDATLVAATVAASGAVLLYHQPLTCFSDALNFALLVLTVHCVARPYWFWGLVLLAAFSHEMVFFLSPWLLWLRRANGGSLRQDGPLLLLAVVVYALFRGLVGALAPATGPSYGVLYYILHNFWVPWLLPGLWALWALVMLAEFGPLLVLAVVAFRRHEPLGGGRGGVWLYLGSLLTLMLLAYDVFRFASFCFLPVVLGAIAVLQRPAGRGVMVGLLVAALGSYAWQHPVPSQQGGAVFTRVAAEMFARAAPLVKDGESMPFADAMAVQRASFAATWDTWLWVAAGWAALVVAGCWMAKGPLPARADPTG